MTYQNVHCSMLEPSMSVSAPVNVSNHVQRTMKPFLADTITESLFNEEGFWEDCLRSIDLDHIGGDQEFPQLSPTLPHAPLLIPVDPLNGSDSESQDIDRNAGKTRSPTAAERPASKRPFACTWPGCEWSFTRSRNLARHERKHTGVRPFECTICAKKFTRSDHLSNHVKIHFRSS